MSKFYFRYVDWTKVIDFRRIVNVSAEYVKSADRIVIRVNDDEPFLTILRSDYPAFITMLMEAWQGREG